jgi:uridine kinase
MRQADLVIEPLTDLEQLTALAADGDADGHNQVSRLIREWREGSNRFSAAGEGVYVAKRGALVCGVCGLNRDPYAGDDSVGRVRRLYVSAAERRAGIGRALVERLMEDARGTYSWIHLRTHEREAAVFYEANGFERVAGNPDYTHRRRVLPATMRANVIEQLAASIGALRLSHPTRVAIDGVDGSGKTTLADELVAPVRRLNRAVIRASVDGFHNPRAVRYRRGADSPEGYFLDSFDYATLKRELLDPLGPDGHAKFRTAAYDYRVDRRVESPLQAAARDAVLLFDGVFLACPELQASWDLKVWLDVPFEITVERAIARDVRNGGDAAVTRGKYERRYVPGQQLYLAQCRPRERADIVVDNSDLEHPKVVMQRAIDG